MEADMVWTSKPHFLKKEVGSVVLGLQIQGPRERESKGQMSIFHYRSENLYSEGFKEVVKWWKR